VSRQDYDVNNLYMKACTMSQPTGYSRLQIRLHWIIFGLLVLQFAFHEWIAGAWDAYLDGESVAFHPLVAAHVIGGFTILVLALWRLRVRMTRGAPPPPKGDAPALELLAKSVHIALYVALIAMPIGGAVAWFGGVELAAEGHELMKFVLLSLFGLHLAGTLFHQFVRKDNLIDRMRHPVA
jgi:cytochrome b561